MAVTAAQTKSLGLAAPVGVVAALVVAAGIFVTPLPFLTPKLAELPSVEAPKIEEAPSIVPLPPPWAELTSKFAALREPPPEESTPTTDPNKPTTVTEATPAVQLNWRYVGYIEEPHRLVGVLIVDSTQHLLSEGESFRDPNQPEGKPVTVTGVDHEKLTIDYHGSPMHFQLSKADEGLHPNGSATIINPPNSSPTIVGAPPGGRAPLGPPRRNPMNRPTPGPNRPPPSGNPPGGRNGSGTPNGSNGTKGGTATIAPPRSSGVNDISIQVCATTGWDQAATRTGAAA